jgi:hypothetical protein
VIWRRRKVESEEAVSRYLVDGDGANGWYVCHEGFPDWGWEWQPNPPYKVEHIVHALTVLWVVA